MLSLNDQSDENEINGLQRIIFRAGTAQEKVFQWLHI